jgi:hypothetical protein
VICTYMAIESISIEFGLLKNECAQHVVRGQYLSLHRIQHLNDRLEVINLSDIHSIPSVSWKWVSVGVSVWCSDRVSWIWGSA